VDFLRILRSATPETLLGGRYRLLGQLGVGGFGQTFLAEDLHLPDTPRCVIKRLKPQLTDAFNLQTAKRLFDTEARTLYQLGDHNQIPRLLAHFEHKQEFYLAQELVVGEPLSEELISGQRWTDAQAIAFLRDILGVLSFVHQQNVIHRDIKPANLIRRRNDGKIVLIDFGAVKQATTQLANPNSGPTQTIAIGTQGYMPNEQIVGNPRFSSDVYAVGMVAIQALTGVSPRQLQEDHQTGEIQWRHLVPHVSNALADVLDTMIRYDFRARYPTAKEALEAIASLPMSESSVPGSTSSGAPFPLASSAPGNVEDTLPRSLLPSDNDSTLSWQPTPQTEPASTAPSAAAPSPLIAPTPITTPNISSVPTEPLLPVQATPAPVHVPSTLVSEPRNRSFRFSPSKLGLAAAGLVAVAVAIAFLRPTSPPQLATPSPTSSTTASTPSPSPEASATVAGLVAQANQLREQDQYQEALALYDQAIALNNSTPEAHWGRCYSLNGLNKPQDALAACDAALKLNANYPDALWSKGYALEAQQRPQEAIKLYDQAIALRPDFAAAWNNKGTALLQLNQPAEAVTAFERATALDPNLAEAWNNRGAALWNLQRFQEAIASVDRALQIQPDYPDAQNLRQQMRQRLGQ
jgi:eukaryotic-like serine/threonine-protein kinase